MRLSQKAVISFELVRKEESALATPSIEFENLTSLFSFQTENSEVGFKYSFEEDGLYLVNKLNNSTEEQIAFFYDLDTNQSVEQRFNISDFPDKEIEFIDGRVEIYKGDVTAIR